MNRETLRGAVVGYGFISAEGHIPTYLKRSHDPGDVNILAVADVSAERRMLAGQALPGAHIYGDYDSLLRAEAANLDFIDICTPPVYHAAIAHAALARGLHVLCEKPLTFTTEEARSLLDHAKSARRVLFPCHNYKHSPMIAQIRELIRGGRIGKVRSVTLNTFRNTHAKGVAEWNSDWRRHYRYSGGGIGVDHGTHSFYLAFDWMGSYPTAVTAKVSNLQPGRYDTEDDFSAIVSFPTGLAHVHLTWTAGMRRLVYTIHGDHGIIAMHDDDLAVETASGGIEKLSIPSDLDDSSHAGWFNALFDDFREAIECGDFAGKEAEQAALCVQVINTAYRSAREESRELPIID
ncbi:MAG TPA: Gfo/Idh/MocA family oxidoreductase [Verrucomicrobiae bacterium]|jgi:predicted dehydrogenase|nr:Gfo/Idh/MocA family oxidoreductase [Verrucomicrobiae bacterium]